MATPEQIAALKKAFEPFDSNEVGAVSAELLAGLITKLKQEPPAKEVLQGFINLVDAEKKTAAAYTNPENRVIEVGDKPDNATKPFRVTSSKDALRTQFNTPGHDHLYQAKTMWDVFEASVKKFADRIALGVQNEGKYEYETYSQIYDKAVAIGKGFVEKTGVKSGGKIGIMLNTSLEWTVAELAFFSQNISIVTMYATFGLEAMKFIVEHAELDTVLTSVDKLETLLEIAADCPNLKNVVVIGDISSVENKTSINLIPWDSLQTTGSSSSLEVCPPTPDDIMIYIYTSGTTGNPKGVMHRHSNMVSCLASAVEFFPLNENDVHIAFLPLAHIMEQFLELMMLAVGGSMGYWRQNIRLILEDIALVKPTVFVGVPRLLNRFYDKISASFNAAEGMKKLLIQWALDSKKKTLAQGRYRSFWDLIVFNKAAATLGGRVRMIATGSAPIAPEMLEFFRIVFSCPVVEGYGMTEVLVLCSTDIRDTRTQSTVGAPYPSAEFKLVDQPELNYFSTDKPYPRGEICVRGPMLMKGYYKDPEKTKETIDEEGFLHTGDVGMKLDDGQIRIIDRVKHIFKLAQGEYVAPEKLEQLYIHCKYIAQIFISGDSLRPSLVAIAVPDPEILPIAAKELNMDAEDVPASAEFKALVLKDLERIGREHKVPGYEIIRGISIASKSFEELGLLTPTFKLKRNVARKQLEAEINSIYDAMK